MNSENITQFPGEQVTGNGGGGRFDERLRQVELDVREIKTDMKHVATRAWILAGVLGGMGVAGAVGAAIAGALIKLVE